MKRPQDIQEGVKPKKRDFTFPHIAEGPGLDLRVKTKSKRRGPTWRIIFKRTP